MIHAACVADVRLCLPEQDPARFLRCLAPYIKIGSDEMKQAAREDVQLLLCLLNILEALLQHQDRIALELAAGLATDLMGLISNHRSVLVRALWG